MLREIIIKILKFFGLIDNSGDNDYKSEETIYALKPIMTDYEKKFYDILKELDDNYIIIPQLNLASVVRKINNNRYYNYMYARL